MEKARGILNDIKHRKLFAAGMAVTEETIGNFERVIMRLLVDECPKPHLVISFRVSTKK